VLILVLLENKSLIGDSKMPGPGQYDVRKKAGEGAPAYGIRGRYNESKRELVPGPGNYEPKDHLTK
jgi:hypothetical protein